MKTKTSAYRLEYLDWVRGLGAVIMLQGHVFHSFLKPELRAGGALPAVAVRGRDASGDLPVPDGRDPGLPDGQHRAEGADSAGAGFDGVPAFGLFVSSGVCLPVATVDFRLAGAVDRPVARGHSQLHGIGDRGDVGDGAAADRRARAVVRDRGPGDCVGLAGDFADGLVGRCLRWCGITSSRITTSSAFSRGPRTWRSA